MIVTGTNATIYVFKMNCSPPVYKIGYSNNPRRRITQFSVLPWRVEIVHTIKTDNAPLLERALHRGFRPCRVRGEWFSLKEEMVAALCSVKEADSIGDFPDNMFPLSPAFSYWSPRKRKTGPRPNDFKYRPLPDGADPINMWIKADFDSRVKLGERLQNFTHEPVYSRNIGLRCRSSSAFKYSKGLQSNHYRLIEQGTLMVTVGRLYCYAANLGLSMRELLGSEFVSMWPANSVIDLDEVGKIGPSITHPDDPELGEYKIRWGFGIPGENEGKPVLWIH